MSGAAKAAQQTMRAERSAARGARRANRKAARSADPSRREPPTSVEAPVKSPLYIERAYSKLGLPRDRFRVSAETTDEAVRRRRAGVLDTLADAVEAPVFFAEWQTLPVTERWSVAEVERVFVGDAKRDAATAIRILRARKTYRLDWKKAIEDFEAFELGRQIVNATKQTEHLEAYAAFATARKGSASVRLGADAETLAAFFTVLAERGAKALASEDRAEWRPVSASTQIRYRSTLRKFFGYVDGIATGVVNADVLRKVKAPEATSSEPRYPRWSLDDRRKYLDGTRNVYVRPNRKPRRYIKRDDIGLLLRLLFFTGMDVGDAVRLTLEQIRCVSPTVWIVTPGSRSKTKRRQKNQAFAAKREIPIPLMLADEINTYLASEYDAVMARGGRLFACTVREASDAHRRLVEPLGYGLSAPAETRMTLKDVRHVAPTHWLKSRKADVSTVSQRLGHAGLNLVWLYTIHVDARPSLQALLAAKVAAQAAE